jgi:hypothetical protein
MVTGAGTSGVETASLQKDYYQQAHYCALYRVNTDAETRQRAIDIVQEQTGKPYHYLLVDKQRTDEFQCAHLIWYAYHEASGGAIDLDENLGTPTWLNSLFPDLIIPDDLALNQNVSFVSGDLDFHAFSVGGFSPITLLVTDAQGRRAGIDPETGQVVNEIPGALFDMHAEPKYLVIPDAQPETYTITVVGTNDGEYTLRMTQVSPEEGIQEHEQSDTIAPGEQHTVTINLGEEEDDSDMAATSPAPAATPAPAAPTVVSSSGKGGGACLNMGFVVTIGLVAMVIGRKRFLVRNPQSRRDNGS